jgi:hypothetical protein
MTFDLGACQSSGLDIGACEHAAASNTPAVLPQQVIIPQGYSYDDPILDELGF